MPKCKFCQKDITWKHAYGQTPPGEKNLPYNTDGSLHDCRPKTEEPKRSVLGTVFPKGNIPEPEFKPADQITTDVLLLEALQAINQTLKNIDTTLQNMSDRGEH